jgi:hypothetical protein
MIKRLFTLWEDGYCLRSFATKQAAHDYATRVGIVDYEIRYRGRPTPPQMTLAQVMATPALL